MGFGHNTLTHKLIKNSVLTADHDYGLLMVREDMGEGSAQRPGRLFRWVRPNWRCDMTLSWDMDDPRQAALAPVFGQPPLAGPDLMNSLIELFSDSIRYMIAPPSLAANIDMQGIEKVRPTMLGLAGVFKEIQWWADRVVAGHTDVVVYAHSRGLLVNDQPFTNTYVLRCTFDDTGRICEMQEFVDVGSANKIMESLAESAAHG